MTPPFFLFVVPQDQESVAEEKMRSEVWLLDYFSQHGEAVRACTFTRHANSDKSQQRSIYIFQNIRSIFRSIDPRPSWTYWPVRCDRTLRTRRPLTWSQVGSFLMSDPWHFPLCITSLKCHLGSRCVFFFPLFTFSPLMGVNCSLKLQRLHFNTPFFFFASPQIIEHTISRQRTSKNVWCKCWNDCRLSFTIITSLSSAFRLF